MAGHSSNDNGDFIQALLSHQVCYKFLMALVHCDYNPFHPFQSANIHVDVCKHITILCTVNLCSTTVQGCPIHTCMYNTQFKSNRICNGPKKKTKKQKKTVIFAISLVVSSEKFLSNSFTFQFHCYNLQHVSSSLVAN